MSPERPPARRPPPLAPAPAASPNNDTLLGLLLFSHPSSDTSAGETEATPSPLPLPIPRQGWGSSSPALFPPSCSVCTRPPKPRAGGGPPCPADGKTGRGSRQEELLIPAGIRGGCISPSPSLSLGCPQPDLRVPSLTFDHCDLPGEGGVENAHQPQIFFSFFLLFGVNIHPSPPSPSRPLICAPPPVPERSSLLCLHTGVWGPRDGPQATRQ